MVNIANVNTYIASMATTIYDKCWWIDKLPPEIDTVLDFGCASGDLAVMVDRIAPGRFRYIGCDNSSEMLALARSNLALQLSGANVLFFPYIEGALGFCDPSKTVLVLNSVLHEVYSYLNGAKREILLSHLFDSGFRVVAIRDMHYPNDLPSISASGVLESKYADKWIEFCSICSTRGDAFQRTSIRLHEFLLKYRYDANWERESVEQYLWDWTHRLSQAWYISHSEETPYRIEYINDFYIPFLSARAKADFDLNWKINTHRKMLLYQNE